MADIAFPTLSRGVVRVLNWDFVAPAETFRSPLDGTLQTGSTQGPRWGCVLHLLAPSACGLMIWRYDDQYFSTSTWAPLFAKSFQSIADLCASLPKKSWRRAS